MEEFWGVLKEDLSKDIYHEERIRKAQLMAEAKARKLFEDTISKAATDEDLNQLWLFIDEDLEKIAKEVAETMVIQDHSILMDYLHDVLFDGKKEFKRSLAAFTADTEMGKLKVNLEKGVEMGAREYDGQETMYYVTVMDGDRLVASIPFVSEDGKTPPEAQMLYDQLEHNNLSNWPPELKQTVDQAVFAQKKEAQDIISPSPQLADAIREFDRLKGEYTAAKTMLKELEDQLKGIKESQELAELYSMVDEGQEVLIRVDDIVHKLTSKSSPVTSYKKLYDVLYTKVNGPIKKLMDQIRDEITYVGKPSRDIKIAEQKTAGIIDKIKGWFKKTLDSLKSGADELEALVATASKTAGINPHCPSCGGLQLNKQSSNSYSCKSCGHSFKWFKDGTYSHNPNLKTHDTELSRGFGGTHKAGSLKKKAQKNWIIIGISNGEYFIHSSSLPENQIDIEIRDYDVPGDWENAEEDLEGNAYEKITLTGSLKKQAQESFEPDTFTPDIFGPEGEAIPVEEPGETAKPNKSYHTTEEIKRWYGGSVPKRDSMVKDKEGNVWKYVGPAGPDTHEIELVKPEDIGPSPDDILGGESGFVPAKEPTEADQLEMEEGPPITESRNSRIRKSQKVKIKKQTQTIACKNCNNYRVGRQFCELWNTRMEPTDKCEMFEPAAHRQQRDERIREFSENYIEAPAMKEDLPVVGASLKTASTPEDEIREAVDAGIQNYIREHGWKPKFNRNNLIREIKNNLDSEFFDEPYTSYTWELIDEYIEELWSSYKTSKKAQLDAPSMKLIDLYNDDPEELKRKVAKMDEASFAHAIEELKKAKGADELVKFLNGLYNQRFAKKSVLGNILDKRRKRKGKKVEEPLQEPFYSTDAPEAYATPKPKMDQELPGKKIRIPIGRLSKDHNISDGQLVKKAFDKFNSDPIFSKVDIKEIARDKKYIEVTFKKAQTVQGYYDSIEDMAAEGGMPSNYGYADAPWNDEEWDSPQNWFLLPLATRDSGLLEQSNAEEMEKRMEPFEDSGDIDIGRASHWAYGWLDQILVRIRDQQGNFTPAFQEVFAINQDLQNYPILNEDAYSEKRYYALMESIEDNKNMLNDQAPDTWVQDVWDWLSENEERALEDPDDQGYVDEDLVKEALEALGYLHEDYIEQPEPDWDRNTPEWIKEEGPEEETQAPISPGQKKLFNRSK